MRKVTPVITEHPRAATAPSTASQSVEHYHCAAARTRVWRLLRRSPDVTPYERHYGGSRERERVAHRGDVADNHTITIAVTPHMK